MSPTLSNSAFFLGGARGAEQRCFCGFQPTLTEDFSHSSSCMRFPIASLRDHLLHPPSSPCCPYPKHLSGDQSRASGRRLQQASATPRPTACLLLYIPLHSRLSHQNPSASRIHTPPCIRKASFIQPTFLSHTGEEKSAAEFEGTGHIPSQNKEF